jgi:hypothetical protein
MVFTTPHLSVFPKKQVLELTILKNNASNENNDEDDLFVELVGKEIVAISLSNIIERP